MRKAPALAALLLLLGPEARAEGLAAADSLNLPVDARSLGMGEASAAVAEGAGGVATNPAALDAVKGSQAYFTHGFLTSGVSADYLSFGSGYGPHHFGFNYYNVGYGRIKGADDSGNVAPNFYPSDSVYGFSYGTSLLGADVAATLKYLDAKLVKRATAVTFDLGGQYRIGDEWRLGLVGQNLGGTLKFENEPFPLPTKVDTGLGWKAAERWWLTLDVVTPVYTPTYFAVGTEYVLPVGGVGQVAFRVGINTKTPALGAFSGVKAGVGFKFKSLDLDYALDPEGGLGQAHHLALGYHFDWPRRGEK